MSQLRNRIASLEALNSPTGPLLICWRFTAGNRATVDFDGQTHTQDVNETREAFLHRLTECIPSRAVVWVSELDEKL
jgi:hypothetical protein